MPWDRVLSSVRMESYIKVGDVILKFDGKAVDSSATLPPLVSELPPGSPADIELWRKGKLVTISLKVGELKIAAEMDHSNEESKVGLGLTVRPLTKDERRQADVASGLLVEDVGEGPAARAGIQAGDVILSVNGESPGRIGKLGALAGRNHKPLALLILRGKLQMYVPVAMG